MIQDLNDIYDPLAGEPVIGPGPKVAKKPESEPGPPRSRTLAETSPTNVKEYQDYMPHGVYDQHGEREGGLDTIRGVNQSFGEQLGRRAANLIPNVAANLVDMAGSMGALLTEWDDERNYENVLNEAAANMKDMFGEVYHHDNSTWAIGDSAWWLDNIFNTAEYAGAFAIGGLGVAKTLGGVAKLAGGSPFLRGVAQLGTSASISYAEAAQGGMQVYKEVYDNQLRKHLASGLDPEEAANKAKHIAAQSAATTAQLGTILTMALNVGAYAPWFRKVEDAGLDILAQKARGSLTAGATMAEVAASLRGLRAGDFAERLFHHSSAVDVLREMGAEGLEEVVQNFSQVAGADMGNKEKIKSFADQFSELESIIDKSATSEGLLAFTLGTGFGGLQHGLIQGIKSQHVEKYVNGVPVQMMEKDGKTPMVNPKTGQPVYEKHWVSPRTVETDFSTRKFDTLKEAVAHDFENFATLQDNLITAIGKNNMIAADEARDQLFDTAKLHAVKSGITDPWKMTFEKIAAMTPAEAVSAGYATDESDLSYKDKAGEAINDIDHLAKAYSTLQKNYGYSETSAPYVDMVFARQTDIYSTENRIKKFEKKLTEQEAEEKKMLAGIDPAGFSETLHAFHNKLLSMQAVEKQLIEDHKALMSNDPKTTDRLLRKYRAIGMGDGDRTVPVRDLDRKLKNKQAQLKDEVTQAESALLLTPEYTSWLEKNPGSSFQAFLKEINSRNNMLVQNRHGRAQLEDAKMQLQIAKENMSEMTKDKNANKFSRKAEEWIKQMVEEAQASEIERVKKISSLAKDKATLARLQKLDQHRIAEKYRVERDATYDRINANVDQISALFQELDKPGIFNVDATHSQIRKLQKENRALNKWADKLDSLYDENWVDMSTDEELDPEEVVGDTTGKTTADAAENPTTSTTAPETAPMPPTNPAPVIPITMQDELEAERQAVEFEMTTATKNTPIDTFKGLMAKYNPAIQVSTQQLVDGMINGDFGFSYDFLNAYIDKNFTQVQAHELLIAARNYAEEIMALKAEAATQTTEATKEEVSKETRMSFDELFKEFDRNNFGLIGLPNEFRNATFRIIGTNEHDKSVIVHYILPDGTQSNFSIPIYSDDTFERYNEKYKDAEWTNAEDLAEAERVKATNTIPPVEVEPPVITEPAPLPEITITVNGITPPSTPELNNIEFTPAPENALYHAGFKIVEAATTGATTTVAYHEGRDTNNKKVIRKIQNPQELTNVNEDILNPLKLLPGTELEFVVDTAYDGPKLTLDNDNYEATTNETEKGADYLEQNGKVKLHPRMIGNVPIKVVDKKTGETLFYLRKLDWLEMAFPGTTNKRNVVEFIKVGEEMINNYEIQLQLLMDIRERIIRKYNEEGKSSSGKIAAQGKGTGRLLLNHVVEKMNDGTIKSSIVPEFAINKKHPEKSMLPEDGLLAIADTGGEPMIGRGTGGKFKGETGFNKKDLVRGAVGQLVKAANGKYMWAPLIGVMNLEAGKPSAALNTIVRAIELYLLNDGTIPAISDEIKKLQSNTSFDLSTSSGLRAFINQYFTYMNGFPDASLLPGTGETQERFLFNVDDGLTNVADKTKQIKAGFTLRGDGVQYANLLNGKLHPAFIKVLSDGLATRPKAVVWTDPSLSIRGINSRGTFTDAIYNPSKKPGEQWSHEVYLSYNNYIKTFSRTPVYGRNQLSDGTYVYTANPQLPMDFTDTNIGASLVVTPNVTATTPTVEEEKPESGLLDSLFGYENMKPEIVKEIGTAPENSRELTIQSLREMYNFTPEVERNGKTPLEVYEDLRQRGHTYISDGFNPFSRCL